MHRLETRIPPPVVMLLLGGLAWLAAHHVPALGFVLPYHRGIAIAIAVLGLALNLSPKLAFDRAGTTVNPMKPGTSARLVTSGLYRHTRNPMYLGQGLLLLGWGIYLHNALALLAVLAFVAYITAFQILPEERALAARFPDEFADFRARVRRWV